MQHFTTGNPSGVLITNELQTKIMEFLLELSDLNMININNTINLESENKIIPALKQEIEEFSQLGV
jgi:hypothetical protein